MICNENIADDEWEWYIGTLFSRLIKKTSKNNIENVVELAPGFRHKIAYALKDINFNGNLYVIDTNTEVLKYVKEKYKIIIPEARIICVNKEFKDSFFDMPDKFDLFLANHCIDDMMIGEYMKQHCDKSIMDKECLINAWEDLEKSSEGDSIINNVFLCFQHFFKNKDIGTIIMSQYKSNAYFCDDFKFMYDTTMKCFNRIKEMIFMDEKYIDNILNFYPFGDDERYRGEYLLNNTQNAENWIVGNYIEL